MTNTDNMFLAGDACSKLAFCKSYVESVKETLLNVDTGLMTESQKEDFAYLLTNMEWLDVDLEDCVYLCKEWFDSMSVEIGGKRDD